MIAEPTFLNRGKSLTRELEGHGPFGMYIVGCHRVGYDVVKDSSGM